MSMFDYAKALLEEASIRLESAGASLKRGYSSYVVRQSQECVELSLKAALRLVGIEYPKQHEVSAALIENKGLYPSWFAEELINISRISKELVRKRVPSMYGEETLGKPPRSLFSKRDAASALEDARYIHSLVQRLFKEAK
ncbi:MAG: HEPN domain-containing protein [Candidatus Geothermarchaeales archaeon]